MTQIFASPLPQSPATLPIGVPTVPASGAENLDFSTILDGTAQPQAAIAPGLAIDTLNLFPAAPVASGGKDGKADGKNLPDALEAQSNGSEEIEAPVGTVPDPVSVPIALAMVLPSPLLPPPPADFANGPETAARLIPPSPADRARLTTRSDVSGSAPLPTAAGQPLAAQAAKLGAITLAAEGEGGAPSPAVPVPSRPIALQPVAASLNALAGRVPVNQFAEGSMPLVSQQRTTLTPSAASASAIVPGASLDDPLNSPISNAPSAASPVARAEGKLAQDTAAAKAVPPREVVPEAPLAVAPPPVHHGAERSVDAAQAAVVTEQPQDFATLVGRLAEAREAAAPHLVRTSLQHAQFGTIALQFRHEDGGLAVTMGSSDPAFAGSVQAALAAGAGADDGQRAFAQSPAHNQSQHQSSANGGQSASANQDNPAAAGSGRGQDSQPQPSRPARSPANNADGRGAGAGGTETGASPRNERRGGIYA